MNWSKKKNAVVYTSKPVEEIKQSCKEIGVKFRNKIGIDIAREALKTAISERKATPKDILHYAKICRVDKIVKPILEAII